LNRKAAIVFFSRQKYPNDYIEQLDNISHTPSAFSSYRRKVLFCKLLNQSKKIIVSFSDARAKIKGQEILK
jgi:hypothetical protein